MGESALTYSLESEADLAALAAQIAEHWRAQGLRPLLLGLRGELGAGKTTWVRASLRGMGYAARVPSPTYTLLERYEVGSVTLVHLDLYRLADTEELEFLGIRDWLADERVWMLVEWPQRAEMLMTCCDILIDFDLTGPTSRRLKFSSQTPAGDRAVESIAKLNSN